MRQFLKSNLSMESYGGGATISLEEEAILTAEAGDAANQADTDLTEAERIIEVSDALEDLAVIGDGIDEATPAEAALFDNAGQMAVAGSDEVAPEEIVPAMESFVGRKISTEGIRETARNIWNSIQKFLKKIWEKIEAFFYKIFGTIPNMRKNIADLKKRVDDTSGKKLEEKKITISTGVAALSVNYNPVKNESDLQKGLTSLNATIKYVFDTHMGDMAKLGEILATNISDFDPAAGEKSCNDLTAKIATDLSKSDVPGKSGADNKRYPDFDTYYGHDLMGNVKLADKCYNVSKKDTSSVNELDHLRRCGTELVDSSEKSKTVVNDFEMQTLSTSAMHAVLDDAAKMLDTLEDYRRGKRSKEIAKAQKAIESGSAKATSAMEKADSSTETEDRASVPYYRAMLNFNAAYARWVQSPAMPMLSNSLMVIRASLHAVSKSITAYK